MLGPDGVPYVLDRTTKTVYRVDLRAKKATAVLRSGASVSGIKVGDPKLLAAGGPDVVVLDAKNVLWRWRPADAKGKGTPARIRIAESATWGADILGFGTYVRNAEDGLYNLYVLDPSEQQILRYTPAQDGSGYPGVGSGYLTSPQDVSRVTSMYIDGEVYLADGGIVERFVSGRGGTWGPDEPPDVLLRPLPTYRLIASPGDARRGNAVRVRFRQRSDRGLRQGEREVPGPVPHRRGRPRLGRRPGPLRREPGERAGAGRLLDRRAAGRHGGAAGHLHAARTPAPSGSPAASPSGSAKPTAKPKPTVKP